MRKSSVRYYDKGIGVGGWDCICCAPPKSHRKIYYRKARKREKLEAFRVEQEEIKAIENERL